MKLFLLKPPAAEPVETDDIRTAARIDGPEFDELIPGLIAAAREMAEHETGIKMVEQVWRAESAWWPGCLESINLSPVTAVEVAYLVDASWIKVPADQVVLEGSPAAVRVVPAGLSPWPAAASAARSMRMDLTVGRPVDAVPATLKLWIKAQVTYWLRNPEAASEKAMQVSPFLGRLLDPHRTYA